MKRNKKMAVTIAVTLAVSASAVTAAAAKQFSVSEIKSLRDAISGKGAISSEADANGDSTVNVFDLCTMKRNAMTDTGVLTESIHPITETTAKFQSRYLIRNDTAWLIQSGSAAEFIVQGTKASVTLAGDGGIYSGEDYRPRYGVFVDGEMVAESTMSAESETITLFESTSPRTATVKVILLSEAMYGGIGVKSVNVTSSAVSPITPVPENDLCIEFIGDSITCAYGVEGGGSSESFKTTTENFTKSYAYLAAQQLGADYSTVSYSGHGVISGYSSGDKNTDSLIPDCYGIASKFGVINEARDFSVRYIDASVSTLGTIDSHYVNAELETRSAEFRDGYLAFLKTIREKNPDATIICTLGIMGCTELYPYIEEAVELFKSEVDDYIYCYQSAVQNGNADGYGSDWHPSAITQQNNGYVMADRICQALGMESSQLGLDVAADGVYELAVDKASGANAAHFVSDFDKSFWINMVMGGDSPDDIEGTISGIGLKKGGEYRLEFDIVTGADVEIPVVVRGESEYFSDSVASTNEKSHFTGTFTMTTDDPNAQIAFRVGGTDYYNVTLSNVKLVKTK